MTRSSKSIFLYLSGLVFSVALQGCGDDDDTTGPDDDLIVDAQITPGHVHSFETDVAFTAKVTTSKGAAVQDFIEIRTEISPATMEQWTKEVPMLFDGTQYTGTTKLTAAGNFDVRMIGQRAGETGLTEIHRFDTPLESVRPHYDAGGYRVEFETDSGDYPEHGYPATFRFLIMEDVAAPRPPIVALPGVKIRCTQGSQVELHDAAEASPGTYSATHVFNSAGEGTAQIEFTGLDEQPAVVQVPLEIY